jgi:hypothetical protein
MRGPPLDLAVTLPDNWQEQICTVEAEGPEKDWIRLLQGYVQRHGHESIAMSDIQVLAKWATGLSRPDNTTPFPRLRVLLGDIEEHAGSWAVETVIEECRSSMGAPATELSRKLEACEAEWYVLRYFLERDWSAVEYRRKAGDFDWHVENERVLGVEVKQKAVIGLASRALEWWLKGLSLLPDCSWMHAYHWRCRLSEAAHLKEVRRFGKSLQANLEVISEALSAVFAHGEFWTEPKPIADTGFLIGHESWGNRPAVALTLYSAPDISIVVEQHHNPTVLWIRGNAGGWMLPMLGEEEARGTRRVLDRLNAAKQAKARAMMGLYVFVWWVPYVWEPAYNRAWMRKTCDGVAEQQGLEYVAVWPQGSFETARAQWVLNTAAAKTFPMLEQAR